MEQSKIKNLQFNSHSNELYFQQRKSLDLLKHEQLYTAYDESPIALYREKLTRIFNEEFIAQASNKYFDRIIKFIKIREWKKLRVINPL